MSTPTSTTAQPPIIGLVGLGLLGIELAERLLRAGWQVVGCDLNGDRLEAFRRAGGQPVNHTAEVFTRCERILLSLPSHVEVDAVLAAEKPNLRPGQTIIDTTTGEPASVAKRAQALAAHAVGYLDATISGSSVQVRDGAAVALVGGDARQFEGCRDVFAVIVSAAFFTGPSGSGAKMKLVTNLVLGLNRATLAEGLALAEALQLDAALTLQVMRSTPAYSRIMDTKGEKMIRREFTPEARLSQHLKDVRLIVAAGEREGLPMTLSRAHRDVLEAAEVAGLGGLDNSALIRVLAARHGEKP
jgi:3-hydroxyisobutyrate dehydrogenase-like beta-hydroxyacid dehydrogenase